MPLLTTGAGSYPVASALDSDYTAWRTAVGSVGATQENATNALIVSLKANSLWSGIDRLWLYASENATQASIDLKALATHTLVNTPTFTASQGYAGNGTSSYINTGFASGSYTQSSASFSAYVRTNRTSTANTVAVGAWYAATSGARSQIEPRNSGGNIAWGANNTGNSNESASNANAQGFWTVSRTGASAQAIYKNSSSTAFASGTLASASIAAGDVFYVLATNQSGTPLSYSTDQVGVVHFGAGLSNTDAAQLQTDINTYMTSIGANVY